MEKPRIAICVVTYDSADLIHDFVASVAAGAAGTDWTLVFADNASTDDTLAVIARQAPEATVIETGGNLGYAAGVNAAVRAAGEQDAYLVVNADVRLGPGCLLSLHRRLSGRVGVAVPRLSDARGALIYSMRREPTLLRAWTDALIGAERAGRLGVLGELIADDERYSHAQIVDWAEGSTQLISARCWGSCGSWNESFFLYSEETEFDLRARDRGFEVWYEPAARAQHLEGGSAQSPRPWSLLVMNRVRLYSLRHHPAQTALFWLATVVREGSRTVLGKRTSRAALRDLVSPRRWREAPGPAWLDGVRV